MPKYPVITAKPSFEFLQKNNTQLSEVQSQLLGSLSANSIKRRVLGCLQCKYVFVVLLLGLLYYSSQGKIKAMLGEKRKKEKESRERMEVLTLQMSSSENLMPLLLFIPIAPEFIIHFP